MIGLGQIRRIYMAIARARWLARGKREHTAIETEAGLCSRALSDVQVVAWGPLTYRHDESAETLRLRSSRLLYTQRLVNERAEEDVE